MRWVKLGILGLLIAGTVVGGYWVYKTLSASSMDRSLATAEETYARGVKAYQGNDAAAAKRYFSDAILSADAAIKDVEAEDKVKAEKNELTDELKLKLRDVRGRAYYVRARAERDLGYTEYWIKNNEKIAEADDSTEESGTFRRYRTSKIDPEIRAKSVNSLIEASNMAPKNIAIQYDMLKTVMSMPVENWSGDGADAKNGRICGQRIVAAYAADKPEMKARDQQILGQAHYFLAKHNYDQASRARTTPKADGTTQLDGRVFPDMEEARKHIDQTKALESVPRWRTMHLDAQIARWMNAYYTQINKPDAEKERQKLRAILRGGKGSALVRAQADIRDGKLTKVRGLDLDGVLELHDMALTETVNDYRTMKPGTENAPTAADVAEVLSATIAVANAIGAQDDPGEIANLEIAESIVKQARIAQRILAAANIVEWRKSFDQIRDLVEGATDKLMGDANAWEKIKNAEIDVNHPNRKTTLERQLAIIQEYLYLVNEEAELEVFHKNEPKAKELRTAALKAVQSGEEISKARKAQLSRSKNDKVRAAAAERHAAESWRLQMLAIQLEPGMKPAALQERLQALYKSASPEARAFAHYLEGDAARREGKLELAAERLAAGFKAGALTRDLRAFVLLSDVLMSLGAYQEAVPMLDQLEGLLKDQEQWSQENKDLFAEVVGTEIDLRFKQFRARLGAAQRADALLRLIAAGRMPDAKKVELEKLKKLYEEEAITKYLPKIVPESSSQRRTARQMLVLYYLATRDKPSDANDELRRIVADYPNEVDVLALQARMAARQPKVNPDEVLKALGAVAMNPGIGFQDLVPRLLAAQLYESASKEHIREADKLIADFVARNTENELARLYQAEWFGATDRVDKAIDVMEIWKNISDKHKPRYQRLLAWLYYRDNDVAKRDEALRGLPFDPLDDPALSFLGRTPEEIQKLLAESPDKFNQGLVLVMEGQKAFNAENFEAAAKAFYKALDYTRYKGAARQGLLRSLILLCHDHPDKANTLAVQMRDERAGITYAGPETSILLPLAYARMRLDDIGRSGDTIDRAGTMAAAMNEWTRVQQTQGGDPTQAILTRVNFWRMAGRPDIALAEVMSVNDKDPKNESANRLIAELAIESFSPEILAAGQDKLNLLKKENPGDRSLQLLQARYLVKRDRAPEAIKIYEDLLQKNDYLADAYSRLVSLLDQAGQTDRAKQWVTVWRHYLPQDLIALQWQIRFLAADGKMDEALKLAEIAKDNILYRAKAVWESLEPTKAPSKEELDRRKELWKKQMAKGIDHDTFAVFNNVLMGLQGAKKFKEAEAWYTRLPKELLAKDQGQLLLANLYMAWLRDEKDESTRKDLIKKSTAIYYKVHGENPWDNRLAANNLAWLLTKSVDKPDPEAARDVLWQSYSNRWDKTRKVTGDRISAEVIDTFGTVYNNLKNKRWGELRELLTAASVRHPSDPRIDLYLGYAYAGENNKRDAEFHFRKAISKSDPKALNSLSAADRKEVGAAAETALKELK